MSSSRVSRSGRSSKPRDKREIKAATLVLGGVFGGFYIAAGMTLATVNAGEMKVLDERAVAIKQERERSQRELYDAELSERAEKITPVLENTKLTVDERAKALQELNLEFSANQEMAKEEAERLTNLSTDCGGGE